MTPHFVFEIAKRIAAAQDKAHKTCAISNHIEEMQWYEGYAGAHAEQTPKGVIAGNWNNVDTYDRTTQSRVVISTLPERLGAIFEKMGVTIEWSDMVSSCEDCGKLVETTPSHAWWKPEYVIVDECSLFCLDCCEPKDKLDAFTKGYAECALWSSNDESDDNGGEPLDKNYDVSDISRETLEKMIADCAKFQANNDILLRAVYTKKYDAHSAGHDFWLTRNGHGAGFWDHADLDQKIMTLLSDASKAFGGVDLYVSDAGEVCA